MVTLLSGSEPGPKIELDLKTFLEESPTGVWKEVKQFYQRRGNIPHKLAPVLRLKCTSECCNGIRHFDGRWFNEQNIGSQDSPVNDYLIYNCRDCDKNPRYYSMRTYVAPQSSFVYKFGQLPDITMDLPSGLSELLGDDYKYFEQGIRAEKRGLGIGALVYYRRVVENQKSHLIEEIIKILEKLGGKEDDILILKEAAKQISFSKAIDQIKEHIPESIRIEGQNPLKALHKALSVAVHISTDEESLEIADSIREILCELCRKLKAALQEKQKLKAAMTAIDRFSNTPTNTKPA